MKQTAKAVAKTDAKSAKKSAKKMLFGEENRQKSRKMAGAEGYKPTCFQAEIRVKNKWRLTAKMKMVKSDCFLYYPRHKEYTTRLGHAPGIAVDTPQRSEE